MSGATQSMTVLFNVVAILVHLWAGCCAHLDHAGADHDHASFSGHRHSHGHHHHADDRDHADDSRPGSHDEEPLELCEHGSCDYNLANAVKVPAPESSPFASSGSIQLITHSSLELTRCELRSSCLSGAAGARLHQPLEIWLI